MQDAPLRRRCTRPTAAHSSGLDPHNYGPLLTDAVLHDGWLHIILNRRLLWTFGLAMAACFDRLWFLVPDLERDC